MPVTHTPSLRELEEINAELRLQVVEAERQRDDALNRAARSRPRVVTTAAELDELPGLTVVLSNTEANDPVVAQKSPGGRWSPAGGLRIASSQQMTLLSPWTVVWSPPVESGETQGGGR